MFFPAPDLKLESTVCQLAMNLFAGVNDAYRQVGLRPADGTFAAKMGTSH